MKRIRPISHDDRLSVVDHLDELRTRIIVSLGAFAVAFGLALWQNHLVLDIVNRPLPNDIKPITLGPAEPFYTTVTNSAYIALLLALPVILYQLYAFIVPAFSPSERRVALPMLLLVPSLFVAGVLFCYFLVLPPALHFLLNFNADQFRTEIRARDYYSFVTLTLVAMGIGFQVPVAILALVRLGVTSVDTLRRNRRYALVVISIVAALLPTVDPVSLLLEMVPLILLYEGSIQLARVFGQPGSDVEGRVVQPEGS